MRFACLTGAHSLRLTHMTIMPHKIRKPCQMKLLCLTRQNCLTNKAVIKYDVVLKVKGAALDEASSRSDILSHDKASSEG
jgi:hypothetical protein